MSAPKKVKVKSISKTNPQLPTCHPHAAGIDIGARQIHVAAPPDADAKPVRVFDTFTDDLLKLRDWLLACGVRTVAMESTGVYWIALYQLLEAAGLEVCLVARPTSRIASGSNISMPWACCAAAFVRPNTSVPCAQCCAIAAGWCAVPPIRCA
jgi:hypothetical protein